MNHNQGYGCQGQQPVNFPDHYSYMHGEYGNHWQRQITIIDAINIASGQVPGQVVKAELEHEKGLLIYEVEIVTAQNVKYEVMIDANSGAVLGVKLD